MDKKTLKPVFVAFASLFLPKGMRMRVDVLVSDVPAQMGPQVRGLLVDLAANQLWDITS